MFGWLARLLGWFGLVACVGAMVGAWILCARIHQSIDRSVEAVTGLTSSTREQTKAVSERVAGLRKQVDGLREGIRSSLEERSVDPDSLNSLIIELRGHVLELHEWMAVASSAGEFVGVVDDLLESLGVMGGAGDGSEFRVALSDAASQVEAAAVSLEDLRSAIGEAREPAPLPEHRPLLERCSKLLGSLEEKLGGFEASIGRAEGKVRDIGDALGFRITLFTAIACLLLVWQAWAQVCLARWGGRAIADAVESVGGERKRT